MKGGKSVAVAVVGGGLQEEFKLVGIYQHVLNGQVLQAQPSQGLGVGVAFIWSG